jgi:hypothetical protein
MSVGSGLASLPYRDTVERALYTAAEAFLAVFVITDLSTLEGAYTAGLAALLSAIKSFVIERKRALS